MQEAGLEGDKRTGRRRKVKTRVCLSVLLLLLLGLRIGARPRREEKRRDTEAVIYARGVVVGQPGAAATGGEGVLCCGKNSLGGH